MYDDPTHIRDHVVPVRLNDEELRLVDALAQYNRRQRAAYIRDLVLASVARHDKEDNAQTQAA